MKLKNRILYLLALMMVAGCTATSKKVTEQAPEQLAATPPMGWNSWDCFGVDVNQNQVMNTARYMNNYMKDYGWEFVVVDLGWYLDGDVSILTFQQENPPQRMDEYGRLLPDIKKFPSAAGEAGFKPLADSIHALGLKFGIHIMRGIPWEAVEKDLTIKGTSIKASEIADKNDTCVWYDGMYGVDLSKPGAQEYYNSLLELYASWDVDYIKADDMSRPYHREEIAALHQAIENCGRPIVLSLSPGESPLKEAEHLKANANLWRVSNDFWDDWKFLKQAFDYARMWQPHIQPGAWPDADMLPVGKLRITGSDSYVADHLQTTPDKITNEYSRFTQDEQVTLMNLWAIIKSPLMVGGYLPENDDFTLKLLTNKELIDLNQHSTNNRELRYDDGYSIWVADGTEPGTAYVALFNTGEESRLISVATKEFAEDKEMEFYELWNGTAIRAKEVTLEIPPHASKIYRVRR